MDPSSVCASTRRVADSHAQSGQAAHLHDPQPAPADRAPGRVRWSPRLWPLLRRDVAPSVAGTVPRIASAAV